MEQILYQKLRMDTVLKPDFVQVGDSSGFFGIMPEIVEQYLPGMKYLNASCCGTQGFHGYLAMLRYNLRRFPSIKYIVVYSGVLGVAPGHTQWRGAPSSLNMGAGITLNTLGEKMETHLIPPWSLFNLPTNSLRKTVLQHTFLPEDARNYVNSPTGVWEAVITSLQSRQGFGLEADRQNVGEQGADTPKCWTVKHETFFDWRSLRTKSYLDAFVEEYVALAHEFGVVPILAFQISSCVDPQSSDMREMRANLKQLQQRFPELKVPFDIIDTYPQNVFSVLVHVQRDAAQETSRRLGRALREIALPDAKLKITAPPENSTLTILKATRANVCGQEADLTGAFAGECNGNRSCDIDLMHWRQKPTDTACVPAYIAEFRCTGGPARILRQESEERFGGRFRLDCREHDRWLRDDMPQGIQVVDARFGGKGGNPMGLVTLRTKGFCDGLTACDYAIKPLEKSPQKGDFTARWYCGATQKTLRLPGAKSGTVARLECP